MWPRHLKEPFMLKWMDCGYVDHVPHGRGATTAQLHAHICKSYRSPARTSNLNKMEMTRTKKKNIHLVEQIATIPSANAKSAILIFAFRIPILPYSSEARVIFLVPEAFFFFISSILRPLLAFPTTTNYELTTAYLSVFRLLFVLLKEI